MNISPQYLVSQRMGNLLDSDSSVSEVEGETDGSELVFNKHAVRTEGDGMECEEDRKRGLQINLDRIPSSLPCLPSQHTAPSFRELNQIVKPEPFSRVKFPSSNGQIESPKELPPKSQLISLTPIRITEKPVEVVDKPSSTATYRFNNSAVLQQKNPKFVPYEPYRGAVRSMTDMSFKTHSRKASTGSNASGLSGPGRCITPSRIEDLHQANPNLHIPDNLKFEPHLLHPDNLIKNDHSSSRHNQNNSQNHSELLLRERLKIQDKDISELQSENARLKKLLVDSMSGSRQVLQTHEMGLDPFSLGPEGNSSSISESFDNLSDEIEVWRSKFMSSCILVEQLNSENRALRGNESTASQLFRDIKDNATLTPELFQQINQWLHHRSTIKSDFYTGMSRNDSCSKYNDNDGEN